MSLPPLTLKIGADTVDLDRALNDVRGRMGGLNRATDRLGTGFRNFGDAATNVVRRMLPISGAVAGAAGTMMGLALATAHAGNEIAKSARATGLGTDAFQEYRFALGQATDITEAEFTTAMRNLNMVMAQAADGSKDALEAMRSLGFDQEDIAAGLVSTEDALGAVIEKLGQTESATEAARIGAEFFGSRLGATLGPQLRESAGDIDGLRERARDLGIVLSDDVLNASEQAVDKMSEVGKQFGAVRHIIGAAMLPALIKFADLMQDKIIPGLVTMADHVETAINWFSSLPDAVQSAAGIVAAAIGVGGPVLMALGAMAKALGAILAFIGPQGLIIGALIALAAAWIKWGDDITEAVGDAVEWIKEKFEEFVEYMRELPARFLQFGRDMIQGLIDGIAEKWEELKERVWALAEALPAWMRDLLGIQSPSLVFYDIGQNIGEGLAGGIRDSMALVERSVAQLGGAAVDGAWNTANEVVSAMSSMFGRSKPIAIAQALINTWQGITEALKLPFPASLAAAARVAAQGFAAVNGIRSARPGGGGGGRGRSGGGGGAASTTAPAQQPVTTFQFTIQNDPMGFGEQFARQMVSQLNSTQRNGGQIRGVIA